MLKNFILEYIMLPLGDKMTKSSFIKNLFLLRKMDRLSKNELEINQQQKLKNLLIHASQHVPYYKRLNIAKEDDPVSWLKKFPILDKALLSQNQEQLLSTPKEQLIRQASSGSSGIQSIVFWNKAEQSLYRATQIRWWEWAGYKMGTPILQTGITPQRGILKSIKDFIFNTYYLQAFAHSKEDVLKALRWAQRQKEPVLAGYASSLFVIATIADEENINVKFKTAVVWGDKLFNHYREKIEHVFQTKVHETYGSAEGLMMGAQYDLDYMYMMNQHVYIEIVDDQMQAVKEGTWGHVLVTNLDAFAMPLIRYKIGDLASMLPKEEYPSNPYLAYPIWKKIIGRDTDLVQTPSGKYLVVHSFTGVFEHIPEIKQFCVIQEHIQGIRIQYIRGDQFSEAILVKAKNNLMSYIQEPFDIIFEEVTSIAPTPSGKPQLIISKLKK
ncbi:MAG: hypothetical protein R2831_02730 [Chitinophagaceae bacterium]